MTRSKKHESADTTEKETIRRNIRHALSDKAQNKFPNLDIFTNIFDDGDDLLKTFVVNFKNAGGKFILCPSDQFLVRLLTLIDNQQYKRIIAIDNLLIRFLKSHDKYVKKDLIDDEAADAAIFHTDALIARNGSICFTQKNILHTSIYNLAQDIIVVANEDSVKLNLKEAMQHLTTLYCPQPPLIEVVIPTLHEEVNGRPVITPAFPRFILFLVMKNMA